jgi:hypothetical protein
MSVTIACKVANRLLTGTLCGVPAAATTPLGGPTGPRIRRLVGVDGVPLLPPRFVRLKVADEAIPATLAVTTKLPPTPFAVRVGAPARPLLSVTALAVVEPLNVALGPVTGTVNVTVTPGTPFVDASMTRA